MSFISNFLAFQYARWFVPFIGISYKQTHTQAHIYCYVLMSFTRKCVRVCVQIDIWLYLPACVLLHVALQLTIQQHLKLTTTKHTESFNWTESLSSLVSIPNVIVYENVCVNITFIHTYTFLRLTECSPANFLGMHFLFYRKIVYVYMWIKHCLCEFGKDCCRDVRSIRDEFML